MSPTSRSHSDVADPLAELVPALSPAEAFAEASRCLFCYDAPCTIACPTHIDVPSFIKKIASDNVKGAARVILDANPMGHSCARACPVEVLCEGSCVMNLQEHRPIAIGRLQRHATDRVLEKGWTLFSPGEPTGKRVAIVGGGPAGLSAAQDLRRLGHAVTIFERRPLVGGLNTYGIAQYKLTPETSLAEAQTILNLGVEVKAGVELGRDVQFAELERSYDAIFLAVGLGATTRLGIPGEELPGVVDALSFIEELKHRPREVRVGQRVVVVGAGNTAVDAATQARRLGADEVTFLYRRTEADASAYAYELELARKDGCGFRWLTQPVRILGEGRVTGIACVRMEAGPAGKGGKRAITPVAGSEHVIPCDVVIKAVGQEKQRALLQTVPGLSLDAQGRVVVDERTGQTTNPKFFAGGDCKNGGKEIVNAAADGKRAAASIDAFLKPTMTMKSRQEG